ncbi:hypothetical protein ACWKX9_26770 [Enterobacter asburiae]
MTFLFKVYAASIILFSTTVNATGADDIGNHVVNDLTQRYQNQAKECGGDLSIPAFECSGIIARITGHGNYDPWNPSPASQRSGGVSFLYWRSDIVTGSYGGDEGNGYVLNAPEKSKIAEKMTPYVLCYFPNNADSGSRAGESGCGEFPSQDGNHTYVNNSSPCQLQGIYTAEQWYEHYIVNNYGGVDNLCGFNVRDYRKDALGNAQSAFYEGIRTSSLLWQHRDNTFAGEAVKTNNEMIIRVWEQNIPEHLPVQAFFYLGGNKGREHAMHDQQLFYKKTKLFLPVIKIFIPDIDVKAIEYPRLKFSYHANDQAIQME